MAAALEHVTVEGDDCVGGAERRPGHQWKPLGFGATEVGEPQRTADASLGRLSGVQAWQNAS